ncbi:hypothetical protein GCM10023063_38130 [Arthrobacter methylotrophus]
MSFRVRSLLRTGHIDCIPAKHDGPTVKVWLLGGSRLKGKDRGKDIIRPPQSRARGADMTVILEREEQLTNAPMASGWHRVCPLDELEPAWGEAALIEGVQVAIFRVDSEKVYAVAQQDPATLANVMARGITGSRGSRPTIASPLHKEIYDLETGECFTNPELRLAIYATRLVDGYIEVAV